MNLKKFIVLAVSALSCVFALSAGAADPFVLDEKGVLTINADNSASETSDDTLTLDNTKLTEIVDSQPEPDDEEEEKTGLMKINVKEGGTLTIADNTNVKLGGSSIILEGVLEITNSDDTKLSGFIKQEDEETAKTVLITLKGGTFKLLDGSASEKTLDADIQLGEDGGTINVLTGDTLTLGNIGMESGAETGDLIISGGGTLEINTIAMKGKLDIQEGTLTILADTAANYNIVGSLTAAAGTTISGLQEDGGKSDFAVAEGGEIKGTLNDIGFLLIGDGSSSETLTFAKDTSHNAEQIGIAKNAVVDIQDGAVIQLTYDPPEPEEDDEEAEPYFGDMVIEGTLKVSSAAKGIYKGDNISSPDLTYITVSGNTDSDNKVVNGIVEIYKSEDNDTPEELIADTLHTQILGIGKISVAENVTFQSGDITFGTGGQSSTTGGYMYVDGGGTFKAGAIDLGTGNLYVQGEGTSMEFLKEVKAGGLLIEEDAEVIAHNKSEFSNVDIAGEYNATDHDLTIAKGGRISGHLTNVNNLKLSGNVLLQIDNESPVIDAKTLDIDAKSLIRTTGTVSGTYTDVIQIDDAEDRDELLAVLRNSQTALHRADWTVNGSGNFDLGLNVLGVDDYVVSVLGQSGDNARGAAALLSYLGEEYQGFGEQLEALNDAQLQGALRTVMAGELAGNAVRVALQQPASSIFRHLDTTVPLRFPFSNARGQIREGYNVWFNPYGQAESADSDGTTFDGYDISQFGFHLGGDIELYNRALLGVLFSYANPQVKSNLGKITASDYKTGIYLRLPTAYAVVANILVGFGNQSYTYKNPLLDSEYHGSSVFASAELTRPVNFGAHRLTPLIALDHQSADIDPFIAYDPQIYGVHVAPEKISQTMLRFGLLGNYGRFRARLQYSRQLAGDDSVVSRTSVLGDGTSIPIRSTTWGKDWLNVGFGGELLRTRYWRLFGDYNLDVGKQTTSHNGSIGAVLSW